MLRTTPEKKHVCTCAHAARVQSLMLLTQRARCFIQQEDCRAAQHRASDVDALLLPSRQLAAPRANWLVDCVLCAARNPRGLV